MLRLLLMLLLILFLSFWISHPIYARQLIGDVFFTIEEEGIICFEWTDLIILLGITYFMAIVLGYIIFRIGKKRFKRQMEKGLREILMNR
ncbi:MAG: hypothetical protein KI790_18465 [Cyclobacteriaceae bacterium]|nr:hypothetical protein [Cyclobacteriaceae bacterium HetDA_MAG_MS6]